jgi:hypothetical protein
VPRSPMQARSIPALDFSKHERLNGRRTRALPRRRPAPNPPFSIRFLNSPEVFFLHIGGEQRGPYTVAHIDHLLNSGLISEETLFWREGLEQWQPVTNLVARREKPTRRWARRAIVPAVLLVIVLLARLLLWPTVMIGWREVNQRDFTAEAAYWRARDVVRQQAAPKGGVIGFGPLKAAEIDLLPAPLNRASVRLRGEIGLGRKAKPATWDVVLRYDPEMKEWTGISAREVPPGA